MNWGNVVVHFTLCKVMNWLQVVANFLATLAQQVSKSSSGSSPFAVAAQAVNISYTGGKEDDITVVVSYVN